MNLSFIDVWLLMLPVIDLFAAYTLWKLVQRSGGAYNAPRALVDRATAATITWLAASLVGTLVVLQHLGRLPNGSDLVYLLVVAVTLPSMASVIWVWRWWTGRF